jgi:acyl-coenzyme A synthetase/AMP-(fatty) acid ligase
MAKDSEKYNIATDCIDKHAKSWENKHNLALISVAKNGNVQKLSYSQIQGLTHRMANTLIQLGIQRGDRILLRLPNVAEFPISFLGAIKAGVIPVPTSPLFTWEEFEYLLKDSGARALVTTPSLSFPELETLGSGGLPYRLWVCPPETQLPPETFRWQDILKSASSQYKTPPTFAEDPAYWLYTSGTTGYPKAAVHAHRSIPAHDRRSKIWQDVRKGDIIFNTSDLNWSYALTAGCLDIWRHGLTTIISEESPTPEHIAQCLQSFKVTTFMSVPGIYRRLIRFLIEHPRIFDNVRVCITSGEKIPSEDRHQFKSLTHRNLYQALGMTENSMYLVQPVDMEPIPDSVGQSVFGEQIQILGEDLQPLPAEQIGILATRRDCPGLMLGYWDGTGNIHEPWEGDWFLSGDFARRDIDGNFFFEGRRDDVITAGGYRISPLEVESVINQYPEVEESAVVGNLLEKGGNIVTAFVVLKKRPISPQSFEEDLQKFLKDRLAKYKIPRRYQILSHLPKTVTGKIKRAALKITHR